MIPKGNLQSNIERFSGFSDIYDKFRPEAPPEVIRILTSYLDERPSLVLDIGCGTGLSSFIWKDACDRVIGIEPNPDMIGKAREKLQQSGNAGNVAFQRGYSNQLDQESESVDIITCSQSFHWMEPASTLQEAARVLRQGGIFAAYDCDWPLTVGWQLEADYLNLIGRADELIALHASQESTAKKRDKEQHLQNIRESGLFRFCKEIVFHHTEKCDAERFVGLALSQGNLQTVFKLGLTELDNDIAAFHDHADRQFRGQTRDTLFSYRMRIGVK